MKKSLLILLFALVSYWGWGQILTFEFSALGGSEVSATSNSNDANLTSSTITRGTGLTASGNGGRFNATSWAITSIANAVSGNDYMEFTITPNSGYQFTVSSVVVQWQRSGTGNTAIALRSSVDSYATDLDTVKTVVDNTSTQTFTWTFSQANSSTAVTYRFYSYAEATGGTGGPGDGTGNDIVIYGTTSSLGGNFAPSISNIIQTPADAIISSTTVSVSADVVDSDGTIAGVELHWGTATGVLGNTINMSNVGGDTYTTDTDIPVQVNGTTVYYEVKATDDDADFTTSAEQSYNVTDPTTTTLPYSESFVADLGDCYPYSVSGATKNWIWNSGGYAFMSGYNSGETEEDWLVLPGINLDNYANEFMTFDTWYQYGSDDANNYLKLYYSTDYFGVGNPTSATWTELPYTQPAASQVWTSSGYVDLTGINGTMVYIAFKYNYEVTKYRNWGVDNISIMQYDLIDWANLQWPGSGTITVGTTFNVYAQCWEPGVTDSPGQGAGITTWIGYSTTDTDPSTWTDWVLASYSGDVGNNDEYALDLGLEILSAGTYYYASRFQLGTAPFQYGGYNGGFWDGVNNVSGVLTVNPPSAQIDWANLQWPPNGTITLGGDFVVYAQVYEPGVTDLVGQGADITGWIGYSTSNTDPSTWTDWVSATFNVDAGINDEYMANIGSVIPSGGTYYYASRFRLGLADYVYGGYNGGFWDGTSNVSGELIISIPFLIINEFDSDQTSTDGTEFIELFDGGSGNTSLNNFTVVLFNGSGDVSYGVFDLDGKTTDANGYFVLGSALVPNVDMVIGTTNILQNGADAVALYQGDFASEVVITSTNLIDLVVYDTDDSDDTELLAFLNPGQPQVNENGRSDGLIHSGQRIPNGSGGQLNTYTYDQSTPTPGAENFAIYTDWTGLTDNNWDNSGNWTHGVPTIVLNANIPNVAKAPFPVINGTAICTSLYMATGSSLQINPSGALTVVGTFTNNGTLTIKSDATGTGSLIENNGVSATVERYLTEDEWHYVSAPVDDPLAGVYLGMYMMQWDEPTEAWTFISDENSVMATDMEGFAVWTNNNATATFTGNLNTGAKSIACTNTIGNAGDPEVNDGYNFAGNPYPSSVNWNVDEGSGWSRTAGNIDLSLYIWNQTVLNYGVYVKDAVSGTNNVDSIIPPHQGFFVHVTTGNATGTLGINNGARIHASKDILKSGEILSDMLKLKVTGNNYADEMILRIDPQTSVNADQMDATKFRGSAVAPQLYSISKDNEELSINSFPVQDDYMVIPVGLEVGADAVYTISVSDFAGFEFTSGIYLEDLKEGTFTKLEAGSTYSFNANPPDEPMRFLLHLNTELAVPENNVGLSGVQVYSFNSDVYVTSVNGISGKVMIYDLLGREIVNGKLSGETMKKFDLSGHQGYMVVKVAGETGNLNQKVYIR